ncbi:A/G-specific adenine glycosylase [Gordonia sp. X0973]|uniref:A/G-specific adenine glycosylase n=1 Tax=Gordonia sp. X0973 TaxID=2742602 RepID=UPI000F523566|nr:A/G-specific adenine glycosylase [Gordonia sp. X0973]QKT08451.1 A/G-specific adenine glycosylase [Gordonia sp. X0973]
MTLSMPSAALVTWFDAHGRDLPWRRPEATAWHILVSEFMLQQTPVARVLEPWHAWVSRWPTPADMAAASGPDVLRAWGKLGYPRRAQRLHQCAKTVAAHHENVVPDDVDALLALPGVGEYTARAVACFAYDRAVPVVDTNVRRVIARACHGLAEPLGPRRTDLDDADALAPRSPDGSPAPSATRFSAALMELGALVCTARNPRCDVCPIVDSCAWFAAGKPASAAPPKRTQRYEGTDRQARGRLLDVLRERSGPVTRDRLDAAWPTDPGQRSRALDSLLVDGLVEITDDGLFRLGG